MSIRSTGCDRMDVQIKQGQLTLRIGREVARLKEEFIKADVRYA